MKSIGSDDFLKTLGNGMKINKAEVEHVARLARLELAESDKDPFSEQLSQILIFMDQLKTVNTENIPSVVRKNNSNLLEQDDDV